MTNFTQLERYLLLAIWIILGLFICYKAKWYDGKKGYPVYYEHDFVIFICALTIILAPFVMVYIIINQFFFKPWYNDK